MASIYPQAQYREYLHMHGDRPSAVNWTTNDDAFRTSIRTGTNTDDLEPFIQAAIDDVYDKGGGELFFPAGTYLTTDFDLKAGVTIVGEGEHTIFKRHSNLPAQRGLINFIGIGAGIRSCCVDGDVTTPTVITGNEGTFDPDGDTLTANSAVWIHPGANNFLVSGVKFTHVGGYSLFMDARTGNLDGGQVLFNIVENCRPHYYKYDAGDTAYGGWTGGFFVKGLCTAGNPYAASNIIFLGNRANRLSGNFIWSHSDDFVAKHRNISVTGNTGQYIGRDFTMIGNVDNATVTGNTVSHIGYYHATDNDTPVVCRSVSSGIYSVAFDNAGYVTGTITGNTCRNVYGGGIDLDGFRDGSVTGNYIFCDPSYSKGIQTGDSNANGGACNVIIENNYLEGCLYGAIILANALDCTVRGNRIDHSNHSGQPIQLFAGTVVPTRNFITQNRITYTLGGAYCIVESGSGWGSSHINYVSGNVLDGGHAGEFFPNASSSSISGIPLFADSTNSSLISRSGTGSSSAVKVYITATSTRKQHLQLQADNSLLNVSADGAAQTGIFATANRTTLGFNDALFTGKVLGDAFFASYDYAGAATSYIAAHANALTNDWALLRFNKASVKWETSLTTSAGARVWTDLVPTPITGLTAGRVTFAASATTLDDDALLTWDDTNKILQCPRLWVVGNQAAQITTVIRGAAAQTNNITEWHNSSGHALAVIGPDGKFTTRDIDSSVGATVSFYYKGSYSAAVIDKPLLLLSGTATALTVKQDPSTYAGIVSGAIQANSTATNAIEVIGAQGGVVADRLLSRVAYYFTKFATATMTAPTAGYGGLQYKAGKIFWYYDDSGTPQWREVDFGSVGAGVTSITGTTNQVVASASTGAITLSLPQDIHTAAGPTFATLTITSVASNSIQSSGSISAVGYAATSSNTDSIQTTTGGVTARFLIATRSVTATEDTAANAGLSSAGQIRIYMDSTSKKARISENGGAYVDIIGGSGVTSITGTANQVVASASTGAVTLSLPQSIHTAAGPTFSTLVLSSAATNALLLSSGSVTAVGLIATGAAYNTIQATAGGLYVGLGVTTDQALYPKTLASNPNDPAAGYGGLSHKSGATYRYWNGSTWADIDFSTAAGVTSITGTANQVIASASTGAVTLSLPQSINTGASVTFSALALSSSATNALGVASGGVSALYLIATRSLTIQQDTAANAGLSSTNEGRFYFDSTSKKFRVSENGGAYIDLIGGSGVTAFNTLTGSITLNGTTNQITVTPSGNTLTLSTPQSIHTAATPTFSTLALSSAATNALLLSSGSVTAVGLIATGAAYNTIQTTTGGLYVGLGVTLDQALYPKTLASSPNNPSAGYGGFSHKSGVTYRYWNGSAWADIDMSAAAGGVTTINSLTGAITLAGTSNQVTLTPSGNTITFSTPQNIHTAATPTFSTLTISSAATNAIGLASGSVTAVGIIATGSAYNSIQSTGGMSGLSHTATRNDGDDGFVLSRTSATARDYGLRVNSSGSFVVYDRTGSAERITVSSTGSVGVKGNLDVGYAGGDHRVFARSSDNSIVMQLFSYTGIGGFVGTLSNSSMYFRTNDADRGYIEAGGTFRMYYGVTFDASLSVGTTLGVTGAATFSSTVVATGAIASNSTAYNAIQAVQANTSGIRTYKFTAEMALYLAKYASSASITGGSTTHGALAYQAGHIYYYWNATAQTWHEVDFSAAGGGVTSLTASTGISVSASTGAVTITNTGVTSLTGTTNEVTVSASTGAVTISLPDTLLVQRYNASGDGSNYTFTNSNSTFIVDTSGNLSMSADINVLGVYKMDGTTIINSSGAFIGAGVDVGTQGIAGGGFNPDVGGTQWTGQSYDISISAGQFVISGVGTYSNLRFKGGCLVSAF